MQLRLIFPQFHSTFLISRYHLKNHHNFPEIKLQTPISKPPIQIWLQKSWRDGAHNLDYLVVIDGYGKALPHFFVNPPSGATQQSEDGAAKNVLFMYDPGAWIFDFSSSSLK